MAINPLPLGGVGLAAVAVAGGLYLGGTGADKDNSNAKGEGTEKDKEVKWRPATEDTNAAADYTSNKYGATYSKYLLGTSETAKDGSKYKDINNDYWWNLIFTSRYKKEGTEAKEGFKTKGDKNALINACKEAYKAESTNVKDNATTNEFEESNVWLFCSVAGAKPKTIKDSTSEGVDYDANSYGGTDLDKKQLISTKVEANDWFWKVQEEAFANLTTDDGLTNTSAFKTLYSDRNTMEAGKTWKVKETCQKAYVSKDTDKSNNYQETDVYKFCSLKGSKASS